MYAVKRLAAFCLPLPGRTYLHRAAAEPASPRCAQAPPVRKMYAAAVRPYVAAAAAGSGPDAPVPKGESAGEPASKPEVDAPPDVAQRQWKLYVIPSSQFAAKAMLALDTQGIPYRCVHVSAVSKELPTGGYLVPEVEIPVRGSETEYTPLADSSAILRAIDEYPHERAGPLYPSAAVQDADEHISSVINAYVLYFNHVSSDGWSRSIRAAIVDRLPLGGLLGRVLPLHALYGSARASFRERVKATLAVGDDGDLTDEKMTAGLIGELERYEAALGGEADYLYGSAHPTAADCALHAMVSRFTDGMGDGGLPAALPRMWEVAGPRLSRLRAWQRRMTERHPMLWHRYVAR